MPGVELPSVILATLADDGTIVRISGTQEILGLAPHELVGTPFLDRIDSEDHARVNDALATAYDGGDLRDLQLRMNAVDTTPRWMILFARRQATGDLALAAYDTTPQRDHTQRVEAMQDATEKTISAKTTALARISHEIRTPMNGILGIVDLLAAGTLGERERELVRTLRATTRSLLPLLSDLLDLSRAQVGRLVVIPEATDVRSIADEVCDLFAADASAKQLTLERTLSPALPISVGIDPHRLRQILTNLVSNALKFTDEGWVRLCVRAQPLPDARARLAFEVGDSGIGVAPEDLERIFVEYEQGDSQRFGGSGLGLAICRQIAAAMGGSLEATSAIGSGSCFTYTVDVDVLDPADTSDTVDTSDTSDSRGDDAPEATPGHVELTQRALSILVAEDNEVNALVVTAMLAQLGHRVTRVSDGAEAIASLEENTFDVLLMDCHMPVMDGFAATLAIRTDPRWQELLIVALTASALPEDTARCALVGMDRILLKPLELAELAEALATVATPDAAPLPSHG